ncbi:MAG TPA: porin [Candidatus Acidoferrum sp.]|nr:porin [Candidatus Acidoferrum sp.]
MNLLRAWFVLLAFVLGLAVTSPRVQAQSESPAGGSTQAGSATASKAEVDQLRQELAAQRRTIEQLKNLVEQLVEVKSRAPFPATDGAAHLINTSYPLPAPASVAEADAEPPIVLDQKAPEKATAAPVTAGWNGEHFYIKSADGQFQIQPYGYVQMDYLSYKGDGAPADTFSIRRGRFGFQGNYGDHYQFGLLVDAAATGGAIVRDIYLNAKYNNAIQVQAGQFKEPFAQEELAGDTNLDFVERGLQAALYPSAASTNRSPGAAIHGDINGGAFQYWAGAFNGKGYSLNNTTSVPEAVGRVRFYPWRSKKDSVLHDLAFGGSIARSSSRGLSNETTAPMTMPDAAYTWLPQFPVNGNVWRYEGEFTYIRGPVALRDEYVSASYNRTGVGTQALGGLGFANLPNIRYQGWNSSATYLLTKERRPENGTPRVKHPVFGPQTEAGGGRGWGAWEVAFRYSGLQGNEPGIFFNNIYTPQNVPTFNQHTDQFSFGVNWYLNYWVRFQSNIDIDRLKQPSTIGAVPQNYYVFEQRLQYRF